MPSEFHDAEGFALVGSACAYELCGERDFLPFGCGHCSGRFCLAHAAPQAHECSKWDPVAEAASDGARALVCPFCKKGVRYEAGPGAAEIAWHTHEQQCGGKAEELPRCPAPGCKKALTTSGSVVCPGCRRRVCLKHRYEDQHECRIGRSNGRSTVVGSSAASGGRPADWLDRLQAKAAASAPVLQAKPATAATPVPTTEGAAPPAPAAAPRAPAGGAAAKATLPVAPKTATPGPALATALARLATAPAPIQQACCQTLLRLLENALSQPNEAKFRQLNRGNKVLAEKVFAVAGAEELLAASGWEAAGPEALALPAGAAPEPLAAAVAGLRGRLAALPSAPPAPAKDAPAAPAAAAAPPPAAPAEWCCAVCTLVNPGSLSACDACGTQRS